MSRLTLPYDPHAAVQDVDGCCEADSLRAVVGPKGAGKWPLVRSLVGIPKPASEGNRPKKIVSISNNLVEGAVRAALEASLVNPNGTTAFDPASRHGAPEPFLHWASADAA